MTFHRIRSKKAAGSGGGGGPPCDYGTEGYPIFIQDDAPVTLAPQYLWLETNAVGTQARMWVEDGTP